MHTSATHAKETKAKARRVPISLVHVVLFNKAVKGSFSHVMGLEAVPLCLPANKTNGIKKEMRLALALKKMRGSRQDGIAAIQHIEKNMSKMLYSGEVVSAITKYTDFLQWLCFESGVQLHLLQEHMCLPTFSRVSHSQYSVRVQNLARVRSFDLLCKSEGSFFAFGGAPMENWYSILREGVFTSTTQRDLLVGGGLLGDGFYLSQYAPLAVSYSTGAALQKPLQDDYIAVAVYQVAGKVEDYKKRHLEEEVIQQALAANSELSTKQLRHLREMAVEFAVIDYARVMIRSFILIEKEQLEPVTTNSEMYQLPVEHFTCLKSMANSFDFEQDCNKCLVF